MLVIQGEEDAYGTRAQVDAIARGVPGPIEVELWPECGHSPHRETPDRLLTRVNQFLEERT